jgi:hypothetical protein
VEFPVNLKEAIIATVSDEWQLDEMARVSPSDSGIENIVMFVSSKDYVGGSHGPRLKVSNVYGRFDKHDNFSMNIMPPYNVFAGEVKIKKPLFDDVVDWIKVNRDPLIKLWNNEYESDSQFYGEIQKI